MSTNHNPAPLIGIATVAAMLGITVASLRTARATGHAPEPVGKIGVRLVWDPDEVAAWATARAASRERTTCPVEGCGRVGWVRREGRCPEHAARYAVLGHDVPGPLPRRPHAMSPGDRHASYTAWDPSGCLMWTGAVATSGYGVLRVGGTLVQAHRVAWELIHGEIPAALTIDHLCVRPLCQDTRHMELVTSQENTRRAHARIRARKATAAGPADGLDAAA